MFRRALALRDEVASNFVVLSGSVVSPKVMDGISVCACPCLPGLGAGHVGAQGVVRRAAGDQLERECAALNLPLRCLSTTLVSGGALCSRVAMVCTTPPNDGCFEPWLEQHIPHIPPMPRHLAHTSQAWRAHREHVEGMERVYSMAFHSSLLQAARAAGHSSIALPTLGTGGQCMGPRAVCSGLAYAVREDLQHHYPKPRMLVRVACFEAEHLPFVREGVQEALTRLFEPVNRSPPTDEGAALT